mmetsp:Transcript_78557/g.138425  ORF Transcript_78557/g.138425 Transcript_78557/m.138425 type:complete len:203 (-) Transcript_78557:366-974(-)
MPPIQVSQTNVPSNTREPVGKLHRIGKDFMRQVLESSSGSQLINQEIAMPGRCNSLSNRFQNARAELVVFCRCCMLLQTRASLQAWWITTQARLSRIGSSSCPLMTSTRTSASGTLRAPWLIAFLDLLTGTTTETCLALHPRSFGTAQMYSFAYLQTRQLDSSKHLAHSAALKLGLRRQVLQKDLAQKRFQKCRKSWCRRCF